MVKSWAEVKDNLYRVEVFIEWPECIEGLCRIESCHLYDKDDNEILDDQEIVDNAEFHSENELKEYVGKHYGIEKDLVDIL